MAWIAVDAGTSVIKSVLFAEDGRELAVARRATTIQRLKPGWAEQDMDEVWQATVQTIRQVAETRLEPIRCIVTTAQGDGCWLVDSRGRPVRPAILWNDGRASAQIERWRTQGIAAQAARLSGSVPYAGLACAILRWLQEHEPERVAAMRWVLTANGWLTARLTGRFVADLSDSSNPFSDGEAAGYSVELLRLYELDGLQNRLPTIVKGKDTQAPLTEDAAREVGLEASLPVVMAPYDIVATAYGAGAVSPGQSCLILGTTLCAETFLHRAAPRTEPQGTMLHLHDGGRLLAIPTLTGCEALEWAVKLFALKDLAALEKLAQGARLGADLPFFLPYLSPAGERAPFLATEASGSFHGLTVHSTRSDLAHAVYEGLTFVICTCLAAAGGMDDPTSTSEVRVCGGGASSNLWCQMIADIVDIPVVRTSGGEIGARGAHLYALYVIGQTVSIEEGARHHARPERIFLPDETTRGLYGQRFNAFLQLLARARDQWTILKEIS